MNLTFIFTMALALTITAPAQAQGSKTCPDKSKLMNICGTVSGFDHDDDPDSNYVYLYQRKIYEAACAEDDYRTVMESENPSKETKAKAEIVRKVNHMFDRYENEFKCRGSDFDLTDGSIIKYAVRKRFRSFIEDVTMSWKLDLNKIDKVDGRTVLDYLEKEMEMNKGNANEPILKQYYELLRKAGAKHRAEL